MCSLPFSLPLVGELILWVNLNLCGSSHTTEAEAAKVKSTTHLFAFYNKNIYPPSGWKFAGGVLCIVIAELSRSLDFLVLLLLACRDILLMTVSTLCPFLFRSELCVPWTPATGLVRRLECLSDCSSLTNTTALSPTSEKRC